jgi:hypothetical protein
MHFNKQLNPQLGYWCYLFWITFCLTSWHTLTGTGSPPGCVTFAIVHSVTAVKLWNLTGRKFYFSDWTTDVAELYWNVMRNLMHLFRIIDYVLTDCMEHRPHWEIHIRSAGHEIYRLASECSLSYSQASHSTQFTPSHPVFLRSVFNFLSTLSSSSCLLLSGFKTTFMLCIFYFQVLDRSVYSNHLSFLDLVTVNMFDGEYNYVCSERQNQ